MKKALNLAEKAFQDNEIPVGAIVVFENRIIGKGYNQKEKFKDPTAHAEMIAISAASSTLKNWRLIKSTIYVTKEPCAMCAGAIVNARISRVVFGAYDEKKGCSGSLYQICNDKRLGSKAIIKGGVLNQECRSILQAFFKTKRETPN